jgi:hypothetical protein
MIMRRAVRWCLAAAVTGMLIASSAVARDAAFMQPGGNGEDEAVKVEPKSEIDIGDTELHVTRRVTLFFVNESNAPVQVEKIAVNSDANITAEISNDDCSKQGTIAPDSRCSVEVSVTPSGAGAWSAEALMTHNGAGRIARAKLTGKTTGAGKTDENKETGLSVTSKEINPVDFGELPVGQKAVRSALMVNDSPDPITLYSIDVIEADSGLKVLDGGCAVDTELKPGESCPVTIAWEPTDPGQISTDLIIRHSGRKGFAVVPVRGKTKENPDEVSVKDEKNTSTAGNSKGTPPPPSADELDKQISKSAVQISSAALAPKSIGEKKLYLIGTVGNRAVLLLPDNTTQIADLDDEVPLGNDQKAKIIAINARSIKISIDGKEKTIQLGESPDLVAKAMAIEAKAQQVKDEAASKNASNKSSSTSKGSSTPLPNPTEGVVGMGTQKGYAAP